jgi:hypothetical protein
MSSSLVAMRAGTSAYCFLDPAVKTAPPRVRHFLGMPPAEGEPETRRQFEAPDFLVVQMNADGAFLYRCAFSSDEIADTWHLSVDDAKAQAEYEFGVLLGEWRLIPVGVKDPIGFVLAQERGSRGDGP